MQDLPAQAIAQKKLSPPSAGSVEFVDRAFTNSHRQNSFILALRVYASGTKSWGVRYRSGGRGSAWSRQTLGPFEALDNRAARSKAADIYKRVAEGGDPAHDAKRETEKRLTGGKDIAWLLDEWIERHCAENVKPKTTENYKQILTTHLLPQCGSRPIGSITKRDMIDTLDRIKEDASAGMAERVRLYAGAMFNWAANEDIIDIPPTYNL